MSKMDEIKERLEYWEETLYPSPMEFEIPYDLKYLISKLEIAEKALTYYDELYKNLYNNIQNGELYENWLRRQGQTAHEALQQIRE